MGDINPGDDFAMELDAPGAVIRYEWNGSLTVNVFRFATDSSGWVNFDVFTFMEQPEGYPSIGADTVPWLSVGEMVEADRYGEVEDAIRRHHKYAVEVDHRYTALEPTRDLLLYGYDG